MKDKLFYLYAFVDSPSGRRSMRGLTGETLETLQVGRLSVVAGRLNEMPSAGVRELERHDRVVRRLTRSFAGVLPVRFGTAVGDRRTLAAMIEPHQARLREALARVTGREQMTLRLFRATRVNRPAVRHPGEASGARGSGTEYLLRRAKEHGAQVNLSDLKAIRARLGAFVVDERVEEYAVGSVAASVYHLVQRGQTSRYLSALSGGPGTAPLPRYLCTGPSPAYAFAPSEM